MTDIRLFRFKHFSISDEKSLMKIGTDSVLLGAWIDDKPATALDIGAGSGLLAIMLAFKSGAQIDAVEIDEQSAIQASENISHNNLASRIKIHNDSFSAFAGRHSGTYDLIVTNPPYFSDSLKSNNNSRNIWRHNDSLSHQSIISGVKKLLSFNGVFYIILPFSEADAFTGKARIYSIYPIKRLFIKPKTDKPANRVLLKFSNIKSVCVSEASLSIRNTDNSFTEDYKSLTKSYYLNF